MISRRTGGAANWTRLGSVFLLCALVAGFCHVILGGDVGLNPAWYDWYSDDTGCPSEINFQESTKVDFGILAYKPDYSQNFLDQLDDWVQFCIDNPGLSLLDYRGPETKTYNCHSYIFHGSFGVILNADPYMGLCPGCWTSDELYAPDRPVLYSYGHSCEVDGHVGKCGVKFLCAHNEYVYPGLPSGLKLFVGKIFSASEQGLLMLQEIHDDENTK